MWFLVFLLIVIKVIGITFNFDGIGGLETVDGTRGTLDAIPVDDVGVFHLLKHRLEVFPEGNELLVLIEIYIPNVSVDDDAFFDADAAADFVETGC